MAKLFNRAKMTTSTTGSGTVTLGSASVGYQSFADAGVSNGDVVQYVIEEGSEFEIGTGTYSATGTSLTRSPTESSNSGAAISLGGAATVSITAVADDLNRLQHEGSDKVTVSSTGASVTGNISVTGTVDGRDVASDGSKLDGIEASADVTDTANVTAAGALMDSEVTNLAQVKAFDSSDYATAAQGTKADNALPKAGGTMTGAITFASGQTFDGRDVSADGSKLDGIESGAEVNDPAFKNIAVSGQSTVVADADADTLNLAAGSNVTITTNASTDTVTIASTDTNTVPNDATITISAGSGLTGGGNFTTDQSSNETITINHQDTSSQASVNNSGRTYIQDITLDTYGHVTGISSATETVTDTNTNQLTTFVEDGDGTEVTISHGKEWKFVEGTSIDINWTDTSTGSDADPYDLTISHADTSTLSGTYGSTSNSTKIDQITVDAQGHITAITTGGTGDITGVTAGSGLTGGGSSGAVTVSHADTSTQASVNNSGRTYIQDITLDEYGHVTGLTSATETVTDTNTNQLTTFVVEDGDGTEVTISHGKEWKFVEGGGIDINWTDTSTGSDGDPYDLTIKHVDTSSQASVNNSGNTVIQDVTLDTYGHVTGLTSKALSIPAAANNATITISAGTDLSTGGDFTTNQSTNETITINHADTSTLSGTYGSTSNGTKIDQITVDGRGHVTAITTGATGSMSSFNVQANGGTQVAVSNNEELNFINGNATTVAVTNQNNPTVQFNHADTSSQASVDNSDDTVIQDITLDTYGHVTGIGSKNLDDIFMRKSATSGLDMNNNNITDVEDIYLQDRIYHDGDTDTYIQFHAADQFRVVTGGTERLEVNNNRTQIDDLEVTNDTTFNGEVEIADNTGIPLNIKTDTDKRLLFRNGRIDAVNNANTAWDAHTFRAYNTYIEDSGGNIRFKYEQGTNRVSCTGSGSRGYSGYLLTTSNDSVANCLRANGYLEWQTDVGAVGTTYFLSDVSLKENIAPSTTVSSDLINDIDFIQFDWKPESGNTGHVDVGVSAQQLQEVDARLVNELSDERLMVNEPALLAHLGKALQEALAKIEALETRLDALEA